MICPNTAFTESCEPPEVDGELAVDLDQWEVVMLPNAAPDTAPHFTPDVTPDITHIRSMPFALASDLAPEKSGGSHVEPTTNESPEPPAESRAETLVLAADREIVLRCGKASITLTRAGKVIIRGAYVGIISSGVNRIQGGSVQIN